MLGEEVACSKKKEEREREREKLRAKIVGGSSWENCQEREVSAY